MAKCASNSYRYFTSSTHDSEEKCQRLQAEIDFRLGDLTEPIEQEKWDIVLSNPPYIAFDEAKEMSDVVLEP